MYERIEDRFNDAASRWRAETRFDSSMTRINSNPAYREIVGMGRIVIPLILESLQRRAEPWFDALRELTGDDPVRDQDRGHIQAEADAWVEWGRSNGLLEDKP